MDCPKCGIESADELFGAERKCPECGAYYDKVVARLTAAAAEPVKQKKAPSELAARLRNAGEAVKAGRAKRREADIARNHVLQRGAQYCTACGSRVQGKRVTKGSILIEILLWLCFFIPGVIYSIWRLTSRHEACEVCGSPGLIPFDSPKARRDIAESN